MPQRLGRRCVETSSAVVHTQEVDLDRTTPAPCSASPSEAWARCSSPAAWWASGARSPTSTSPWCWCWSCWPRPPSVAGRRAPCPAWWRRCRSTSSTPGPTACSRSPTPTTWSPPSCSSSSGSSWARPPSGRAGSGTGCGTTRASSAACTGWPGRRPLGEQDDRDLVLSVAAELHRHPAPRGLPLRGRRPSSSELPRLEPDGSISGSTTRAGAGGAQPAPGRRRPPGGRPAAGSSAGSSSFRRRRRTVSRRAAARRRGPGPRPRAGPGARPHRDRRERRAEHGQAPDGRPPAGDARSRSTSASPRGSRLPVFSSDAISSTAYATEEILFVIAVGALEPRPRPLEARPDRHRRGRPAGHRRRSPTGRRSSPTRAAAAPTSSAGRTSARSRRSWPARRCWSTTC